MQPGAVVRVKDTTTKSEGWQWWRKYVHPVRDGVVRAAKIKTTGSTRSRNHKLVIPPQYATFQGSHLCSTIQRGEYVVYYVTCFEASERDVRTLAVVGVTYCKDVMWSRYTCGKSIGRRWVVWMGVQCFSYWRMGYGLEGCENHSRAHIYGACKQSIIVISDYHTVVNHLRKCLKPEWTDFG